MAWAGGILLAVSPVRLAPPPPDLGHAWAPESHGQGFLVPGKHH
jgi:hypothetical protein